MEFKSIPFFHFLHDFFSKFSSHPLFSMIVALYTLILIYAPSFFLKITLSPVLNSTAIILLFLLRLGAKERPKTKFGSQEYVIIGYGVDERLDKESDYLESRVLDCEDKWLPVSGGNLALYPGSALESSSMESRFLESIDQRQTHVEFEPKIGLGHEVDETHLQFDPNTSLGHVSYQTHDELAPKVGFDDVSYQSCVESKPGSGLKMECNQSNIEFEHDLGMESNSQDDHQKWESLETNFMESSQVTKEEKPTMVKMDSNQVDTAMMFLEWNMRTPLEIIYEEYEEEEEEEDDDDDEKSNENDDSPRDKEAIGYEKYPSLSMYYPESETDSSSNDDFSMNENWETHESALFKWEEEEREELIEISLDRYGKRSIEFCHAEEDNLIEIDIFSKIN